MKYIVHAKEMLYYTFVIDADSLEDAQQKAWDYSVTEDDIDSADYYQIEDIYEDKNDQRTNAKG